MVCPDLDSQVCILDREHKVVAQLGDGQAANEQLGLVESNREPNLRRDSSSRHMPPFSCVTETYWWPSGCQSGALHSYGESQADSLAHRLLLFGIGAALLLILRWLLIHVAPDGVEHGELGQFVGRFHPLVVHLPSHSYCWFRCWNVQAWFRRWNRVRESAEFVLTIAVIAAFVAAFLGWLLPGAEATKETGNQPHVGRIFVSRRSAPMLACVCWDKRVYGVALLLTLILLAWTADKRRKLTHGEAS